MQLRDYQETFATGLATALAAGKRKLVGQLPTGGGKTVVFSAIASRFIAKSTKSVLILVHRKELLQQTRRTLYKNFGIIAEPIMAGMKYIKPARIYVGMVESVNRRVARLPEIGLAIIDEAHIAAFNKLHQFFPTQYIIGVTATPQAASKKNPMKNHYDDIVCSIDIPELINMGFLAQNITIAPKEVVDRAELAVKGNDFQERMMGEKFSAPKYIQSTIHAYEKYGLGKKTIIFNATVEHSLRVTEAFRMAGYNCRHIDGNTPKPEREAAFEWLKNTKDAILCNVGIATTGFDEPTIELVIVNKATMSMPLWLQMSGRGGRIVDADFIEEKQKEYGHALLPKSAFTIIDMGGNATTHGDWCDSRDWNDLFHNPRKPSKSTVAPVKSCPECDAIIPAPAQTCKFCGYEYPPPEFKEENTVMKEFIIVTKGIDVKAVIEENRSKKEYYPFFLLGRQVAIEAKARFKTIGEEELEGIKTGLHELSQQWCREKGKRWNQWHREKAEENLYVELAKRYKAWKAPIDLDAIQRPERKPDPVNAAITANPFIQPVAVSSGFGQSNTMKNAFDITL